MLNEDIKDTIHRLVAKIGNKESERYLTEVLTSISRISLEGVNTGDWKLFNRAVKEFKNSFKVFSKYRDSRKVCLFGSARLPEDHPEFKVAEDFAQQMAANKYMIITGAGGGIMAAGNKGATPDMSFGVNIQLPFEQSPNEYIDKDPKLVSYKYFFIRKLFFIKESDATVLCPGGFGTLDEGYEGLTLLQTGKSAPRPVILLADKDNDYWEKWVSFFSDVMLPDGYISPDDLSLFTICKSAEDAVNEIVTFYKNYHSIRYVGNQTVMRLEHMISERDIAELNDLFSDIVVDGKIREVEPFDEEKKTRDQLKKKRLAFHFNKLNFGRLVEMIRWINSRE